MTEVSAPALPIVRLTIRRVTRIAPKMTRIIASGPAVEQFDVGPFTDTYVRIVFPAPGATRLEGYDLRRIHAELPAAARPRTRTYTVRHLDRAAGELAIDIVDHGRPGLTPSWLATLRPGHSMLIRSPRGLYRPGTRADWHLLAGDAVALPAIAVSLEAMPAGTRAKVIIEVRTAAEEQPLLTAADADIRWVHRDRGETLVDAVRELAFEPGPVQAFVHGEGGAMQVLRRHLHGERGVPRELLSLSGYWRRGLDDEQWRRLKSTGADTTESMTPGSGD